MSNWNYKCLNGLARKVCFFLSLPNLLLFVEKVEQLLAHEEEREMAREGLTGLNRRASLRLCAHC